MTGCFEAGECDVCVLEEPEHLNWYHSGANWRHRFKLVVGVVHTNYLYYAKMYAGAATAAVLKRLNEWMCGAYCDRVIKLSGTIQPLPRAVVCNVHGVRSEFLEIGRRAARSHFPPRRAGAYFLGKVLWAKGHRLLIDYLSLQQSLGQPQTHVDVYGGGEDLAEVEVEAAARELRRLLLAAARRGQRRGRRGEREGAAVGSPSSRPPTTLAPRCGGTRSEAEPLRCARRCERRLFTAAAVAQVFINPSQSEVLSTTTAEVRLGGGQLAPRRLGRLFTPPAVSRRWRWASSWWCSATRQTTSLCSSGTRSPTTRPRSFCSSCRRPRTF